MAVHAFTHYLSNTLVSLGYDEYEDKTLISWTLNYEQSDSIVLDSVVISSDTIIALAKRLLDKSHKNYVRAITRAIIAGKFVEAVIGGKYRAEYVFVSLTPLQEIACETLFDCITDELRSLESSFLQEGYMFLYDANNENEDKKVIYNRIFGNFRVCVIKNRCDELYISSDPDDVTYSMNLIQSFIGGNSCYFDVVITLEEYDSGSSEYVEICENTLFSVVCEREMSSKKVFSFLYKEYVDYFHDLISEGRMVMGIERPERDEFFQNRYLLQRKKEGDHIFWGGLMLA